MSDPGSETTAGAETATALPRSRSATAALILGILGLPSYPIGIVSILAIAFGMKALGQIRARRARGRGMSIAGIVLGMTGVLATTAAWTYFLSTLLLHCRSLLYLPRRSPRRGHATFEIAPPF